MVAEGVTRSNKTTRSFRLAEHPWVVLGDGSGCGETGRVLLIEWSPTMPLIPENPSRPFRLGPADMSPAQADLVRRIVEGPRKDLPVNMETWLHSPRFAELSNDFAEYVGHLAPKNKRLKEIAILVVAAGLNSAFEWYWHERLGRQLGLTSEQLTALNEGRIPVFEDAAEQVTCELSTAMVRRQGVDQALHDRAVQLLGRDGVADLIGLLGLYVMVAYSLDFYDVPVPAASDAA